MTKPARPERDSRDALPVSRAQVTAFRLRRHHLLERAPAGAMLPVIADMGGAQAQVLSAAQLALWARVQDLTTEEIDRAIWKGRSLARAWCMRRTLHLLPSRELAMFVRGSARRAEKEIRWMRGRGFSEASVERLVAAVLASLDRPRTRSELAEAVGRSLRVSLRSSRGGGWGNASKTPGVRFEGLTVPSYYLLHLAGARGVICSGPSQGGEATYVRADAWVRRWRDLPPEDAEGALLRRYLAAYGPATAQDFAWWTQMRLGDAREIWERERAGFTEVSAAGTPGWILRGDLSGLSDPGPERSSVRLLPHFDSYLLGHPARTHLVPTVHHKRVYRDQGWVSSVVLVNGRVAGVWSQTRKADRLQIAVAPFERISRHTAAQISKEANELARFLQARRASVRIGRTAPRTDR